MACGGATTVTGQPTAAAPTADAGATTAGSAAAGCAPAAAVLSATKGFPEVTDVQLDGGCGQVSVATSLPPGVLGSSSATKGTAICTAVSEVAYVGDIFGVTVVAQDGSELAGGVKDHPDCIPG